MINAPAKSLEFRAIDAIRPRLINQPERPNRLNAISCQDRGARGGIPPEEFEIDTILQAKGAARLRELLPEIPPGDIREGMSMRELPAAFTVEVFCSIVKRKKAGTLFN